MKIGVCIKQVPHTETRIRIAEDGVSINPEGVNFVINPYDEYAVEEALRIREAQGGSEVVVLSVGTDKAEEALRTALAMGADRAVLITDEALRGSDLGGTATVLAQALAAEGVDLVLCGKQAVDDDCAAVGAMLAEKLGWPQATVATGLDLAGDGASARATLEIDGGSAVTEVPLPAVVTAQKGLNEPRYPSLPGIMQARRKPLEKKGLADLQVDAAGVGTAAARIKLEKLASPPGAAPRPYSGGRGSPSRRRVGRAPERGDQGSLIARACPGIARARPGLSIDERPGEAKSTRQSNC